MKPIPVAVVGCGMSARTFHLPLIAASDDFRLAALVSSCPQPDIAVAQFPDAATMLAQSDAELVVITAPNAVQFSLAALGQRFFDAASAFGAWRAGRVALF